jgi:signal transduction histidine kinase/DNA-binding response OmpR family regulator/CHASE3 domain sensor protein
MPNSPSADVASFRRILTRNIMLPVGIGLAGAAVFVAVILHLLSVIGLVEHTDGIIKESGELSLMAVEQESAMRGYLIGGNESLAAIYADMRTSMERGLDALEQRVSDNPAQVQRLRRIQQLQAEWNRFADTVMSQRRAGSAEYTQTIQSGQGRRVADEVRREFSAFSGEEQRLRRMRNEDAQRTAIWVLVGFVSFTVLTSLLLAWVGRRELLGLARSYDEILDRQQEYAQEQERQAWLRSGQSQLAERLIGQSRLDALGRAALEHLAAYLGFQVGTLHHRLPDGRLTRVAAWGLPDEADPQAPASGLAAEAAASNRTLVLDALPEGYLRLSSGVVSGPSQSALIVPLSTDGQVNGVLEAGFLRRLDDRDQEFLELVSGGLATAINTSLFRQRLQEALSHAQQLNEELQVQQEELRTANEELEEQSRVLKESQAQLEGQQAELEQTNEQLAEQAEALEQRNLALNRAQADLRDRAEELQRASRYKSEFLANMSHELRTPLNSSLILARLLADNGPGNLTAEQVKFAESIHSAGNDLLNLINDILDISKVEAGRMDIVIEPVSVERMVQGLRQTFSPIAQEKRLAFDVQVAPDAPRTLDTDRQRVEQILKNLLSNAFKFTEGGRVSIAVGPDGQGGLGFAVSDTGIGIAPEQQEVIFEAFRQADGTTSRRFGGTGLGLSISRDLAQLLGGRIDVSSRAGHGSTFTLRLPLAGAPQVAPPAVARLGPATVRRAPAHAHAPVTHESEGAEHDEPGHGEAIVVPRFPDDREQEPADSRRTVLVIEDEPQFAHVLYDLAHERNYRCLVAHGAEDGLELAARHAPDAILLDMRLPDRPGLNVLQRLKHDARTRHIPVHVISASDAREAALHLGAVGYALKPATREQLLSVFQELESRLTQRLKRVLLVEDDERQRESVVQLIGDDDVQITAVAMGGEALALLGTEVFDCMVIDLKLPDMDGAELLERMSNSDIRSYPPVIVYTGRSLTRAEEQRLLRYSRSIIIKGARSPERLLDEVTLFLHRVESNLSAERRNMLRTARSREKVFEQRRVLLADDDVRNVFALTSALEQKGLTVEVARNGIEALEKLGQFSDIDLVLMDVMMPEMDGLEAMRRIRDQKKFAELPIIAVTAKATKDDQEECLKAGASDYLAKPIDLDRLFSLLRVWMPRLERF